MNAILFAKSNFRKGGANLPVCLDSPQGIATISEITFGNQSRTLLRSTLQRHGRLERYARAFSMIDARISSVVWAVLRSRFARAVSGHPAPSILSVVRHIARFPQLVAP